MKMKILAGAAALALALPAMAQTNTIDDKRPTLTAEQTTMYDGWPDERRVVYDAWPGNYQTYYWTLTPVQQDGWWVLTDDQRSKVYAMTPEQRTAAWASIAGQMSGTTTAAAATTAAATASTSGMRWVSNAVVQTTPAAANANLTDASALPVCKPNQQDGCINSWEKNKTGTRPLDRWPGKPASEM